MFFLSGKQQTKTCGLIIGDSVIHRRARGKKCDYHRELTCTCDVKCEYVRLLTTLVGRDTHMEYGVFVCGYRYNPLTRGTRDRMRAHVIR